MQKSAALGSAAKVRVKPKKPKNCPLTPSSGGSWVKKIRGRVYSFGPWHDLDGALAKFHSEATFIAQNGYRPAVQDADALTVEDLANLFLERQWERASAPSGADEKITSRHYSDLKDTCNLFAKVVGRKTLVELLLPADFTKARKRFSKKADGKLAAPATIAGHIRRLKAMLNWAYDSMLIDRPIRTGAEFRVPSKKTFRNHRNRSPIKAFSAEEIHDLIKLAPLRMKAAIWLGINCGFNNSDIQHLPLRAYENRIGQWLDYPRQKTAIPRRVPLWPETVSAIDAMLANRVSSSDSVAKQRLFTTRYGNAFAHSTVSTEIKKLKAKLKIERKYVGFNALRHCVETFGGKDQTAIDVLLGHANQHISADYREVMLFPEERLLSATTEVRTWLGDSMVDEKRDINAA